MCIFIEQHVFIYPIIFLPLCICAADRVVDAIYVSRLPNASGSLHQPWSCAASNAFS